MLLYWQKLGEKVLFSNFHHLFQQIMAMEDLCSVVTAYKQDVKVKAGSWQDWLVTCWHLSYAFVCGTRLCHRRDRYSPESDWAQSPLFFWRMRHRSANIQTLYLHIWLTRGRKARAAQLYWDGLFISYYRMISGDFIVNESTAMIYLFRLPW